MGISPGEARGQSVVDQVVTDIDSFWSGEFANYGLVYASPQLQAVDAPVGPPRLDS
jgi:predicted metalloprotease